MATKQFDRITRAAMAQSHRGIVESSAAAPSAQSALQYADAHGLVGPSEEPPTSAAHGGTGGDTTLLMEQYGGTHSVCAVTEIPAEIRDQDHGRFISGTAERENPSIPEAAVRTTPEGNTRSRKSARVLPRDNTSAEVIVHYAVPEGQRFLPITLNHTVTMIHLGRHHEDHVYEPINTWLRSGEDGLRYHRSMHEEDAYDGPPDM